MNVPGHDTIWLGPGLGARCRCGWRALSGHHFETAHAKHAREARAEEEDRHRDWYERTHHCGACGSPGTYCLCTTPCGCADLHPVGSGLQPGALDGFAETPAVEQGELFG